MTMKHIRILKNTVQEYDWGSHTAIPRLLGNAYPSDKPQAEMWMGAHPKAPSFVLYDHQWISLSDLIRTYPAEILGYDIAEKFNNALPYLFKVLAADKPLSIQAHPDRAAAEQGYLREEALKIPMNAYHRNYKDNNHKPECICSLTPFWALKGFRPVSEILSFMKILFPESPPKEVQILQSRPDAGGLENFFHALMTLSREQKKKWVQHAVEISNNISNRSPEFDWIIRLNRHYSEDIGVLSPVLLNLVCLKPGEAMYLGAGELHAYLEGTGIELMANSDNVLRGGLTPKHIDIDELLTVLHFEERNPEILTPAELNEAESQYVTPAEEFRLSRITVSENMNYSGPEKRSAEILLCIEGNAAVTNLIDHLHIRKGNSVFIPAAAPAYTISGTATLYKAAVPMAS